jgi:hypothetical protein
MGDVTFTAGVKITLLERNSLEISVIYRGKREGLAEIIGNVACIRQEKSLQNLK